MDYTMDDLKFWDQKIQIMAEEMGLDCFEQEFELCDYYQMLGYLAYTGMPVHYPHWSYGKAFEKQETIYRHGLTGLPYEMVINSNPALAYLMKDNSLALQILTMAHVSGHNDFFKNNLTFRFSRPEYTLEMVKAHADRIRGYVQDPSIGLEKVEKIIDAAHALCLQCQRNLEIKKLSLKEQRERIIERSLPKKDEFFEAHKKEEYKPPELNKIPLEPEEDILLFIRDYNPYLVDWQKDILTIVYEETQYFLPQIETKIMNEGWASFWHFKILNALELPQGLHLEFLTNHNQVMTHNPRSINPYYVGFSVFLDIEKRLGKERMFQAREVDRDVSFLRQYLTEELMRELNFFAFAPEGPNYKITDVSDEDGWKKVRDVFLKSVGLNSVPVIKILDSNFDGKQTLYIVHEYDGRDLEMEYAHSTLKHLSFLWQRKVILETMIDKKPCFLSSEPNKDKVEVSYNKPSS